MVYLASVVAYKLILDLVTYQLVGHVFPPYTLTLDLNWFKLVESYGLLFGVAMTMPWKTKKPSSYLLGLLFLLSYVPILSVYGLANQDRLPAYAITAFWIGVALLTRSPVKVHVPRIRGGLQTGAFVVTGLLLYGILAVLRLGPSLKIDFTQVYEVRSSFVAERIPYSLYVFPWLAFVVCPILLALLYTRRRYISTALVAVLQLQLFTTTGNKMYLFGTGLALLLLWIVSKGKDLYLSISWGLSSGAVCGALTYSLFGDVWVSGLVVNRLLILPATISFHYFDFFGKNGFVYFGHSFLKAFVDYPYQVVPYKLIGSLYFNNPDNNANTGIVADAYMNFGYTGVVITGIGLVVVLKMVDALCVSRDRRLVLTSIALPMMNLVNVGFYTTLLTNGLGLALLLSFLLPWPNSASSSAAPALGSGEDCAERGPVGALDGPP